MKKIREKKWERKKNLVKKIYILIRDSDRVLPRLTALYSIPLYNIQIDICTKYVKVIIVYRKEQFVK